MSVQKDQFQQLLMAVDQAKQSAITNPEGQTTTNWKEYSGEDVGSLALEIPDYTNKEELKENIREMVQSWTTINDDHKKMAEVFLISWVEDMYQTNVENEVSSQSEVRDFIYEMF